jgi:2-polyprenyl-3-methyl-5-hydroxy-6-metoxy-1,4-benzoquinol methylase
VRVDQESLDQIARNYHLNSKIEDKEYDEMFHRYCFGWVQNYLDRASVVLEMGFGEGNLTKHLLAEGKEVHIIEGSGFLVEQARKQYPQRVSVFHSLFDNFKPPKKYELILATNILEHVEDPVSVLVAAKEWLSETGILLVTVPNAESLHRRLAVLMNLQPELTTLSARDHLVGHLRVYSLETLKEDIQKAGLSIQHTTGFVLKVLPNSMMKGFSESLMEAMHKISPQLDVRILANLGVALSLKI